MLNKGECRQVQQGLRVIAEVIEAMRELHEAVRIAVREGDMGQLSEVLEAIKKKYGKKDRRSR